MHEALEVLLADGVIDEVVARLKSGKEADVYIVSHGGQYVAAKIYKERNQRNFKNNSGYKEGRLVRNSRTRRAMEKGSRFGAGGRGGGVEDGRGGGALQAARARACACPAPVMFYEGVLLMELVVDPEGQPAPRLDRRAAHARELAAEFYSDLRQQAVKMLCCDLIHGDLSAYNILLGANGPTIIDFPQTVGAAANSQAEFFFKRDVDNLRLLLRRLRPEPAASARETRRRSGGPTCARELTPDFEPSGRFQGEPSRERRSSGGPRSQDGRGSGPRERPRVIARPAGTRTVPGPGATRGLGSSSRRLGSRRRRSRGPGSLGSRVHRVMRAPSSSRRSRLPGSLGSRGRRVMRAPSSSRRSRLPGSLGSRVHRVMRAPSSSRRSRGLGSLGSRVHRAMGNPSGISVLREAIVLRVATQTLSVRRGSRVALLAATGCTGPAGASDGSPGRPARAGRSASGSRRVESPGLLRPEEPGAALGLLQSGRRVLGAAGLLEPGLARHLEEGGTATPGEDPETSHDTGCSELPVDEAEVVEHLSSRDDSAHGTLLQCDSLLCKGFAESLGGRGTSLFSRGRLKGPVRRWPVRVNLRPSGIACLEH